MRASLVPQLVKNLPAVWETWVQSLGWEDPLAKIAQLTLEKWSDNTFLGTLVSVPPMCSKLSCVPVSWDAGSVCVVTIGELEDHAQT